MSESEYITSLNYTFIESWKVRLTLYEKARIISARALQLAMGASPLIDISTLDFKKLNSISIAEEELKRNVLPITVRRRFPNGSTELISVRSLRG